MHRDLNVSRERVVGLIKGDVDWGELAGRIGVAPGLAYMIATGVPADVSGAPEVTGPGANTDELTSPQHLVNPRAHNPLGHEAVENWVRERARRELKG